MLLTPSDIKTLGIEERAKLKKPLHYGQPIYS